MFFKSFEYIKDIEKEIKQSYSLPIFKGYIAINKRGVEKLIDQIYANLPTDLKEAKKYLEEKNIKVDLPQNNNLYTNLKDFEDEVDKSFHFAAKYVIMNVKNLENLLNRIYSSMPQEIIEAQNNKKL